MGLFNTVLLSCLLSSAPGFVVQEDGDTLTLMDGDVPVFVYHIAPVSAPEEAPQELTRAGYIHPLYDPAGAPLTEDYPADHYHHRGVFTAWPDVRVGDRTMDVWLARDARPHVERWELLRLDDEQVMLRFHTFWSFDETPDMPQVRETLELKVFAAEDGARAMDVSMHYTNSSDEVVSFHGAPEANKGYGGLNIRPDATRQPLTFTTAMGVLDEDSLHIETPWVDVSYPVSAEEPEGAQSGVAIFQHPENPGFPHPGWILRHYGFLGVSWPHTESHDLAPGESFALQYRILTHQGDADSAGVAGHFDAYQAAIAE